MPPTFGPRCTLCWESFRIGDAYKSIWPKRTMDGGRQTVVGGSSSVVRLGISVHPRCFGQLDPGDLTRIFGALEGRLAAQIAVLNGRRVDLAEIGRR